VLGVRLSVIIPEDRGCYEEDPGCCDLLAFDLLFAHAAVAMPLKLFCPLRRTGELLQLISVDYRALKDSPTAMASSSSSCPIILKQFEVL